AGSSPPAQITPTGTTCSDFKNQTAQTLSQVTYQLKGGFVFNTQPGVFFYYLNIPAQMNSSFTIEILQSKDNLGNHQDPLIKLFSVQNNDPKQVVLYDANCNKSFLGTVTSVSPADVTISVTNAPTGVPFFVGIKYDAKSVVGSKPPNPTTVTYTFQ